MGVMELSTNDNWVILLNVLQHLDSLSTFTTHTNISKMRISQDISYNIE